MSSDTKLPADITSLSFIDRASLLFNFSLKISPVDKCNILYLFEINLACVPFPDPGGPKKLISLSIFYLLISSSLTVLHTDVETDETELEL